MIFLGVLFFILLFIIIIILLSTFLDGGFIAFIILVLLSTWMITKCIKGETIIDEWRKANKL